MPKSEVVVDTNVLVVANGDSDHAGVTCQRVSIQRLRSIQHGCRLLLDSEGYILTEYRKRYETQGEPKAGFYFYLWAHSNQENPLYCRKVYVTPEGQRGFEEFPGDKELADFDRDDRVFVAVSRASGTQAVVVNATDSDWWCHRDALEECRVDVEFLCPELMRQ